MTVGMNAPYIYPGSGGVPGYGPPQAPQEPEGGCPEGMMWNGTMCVIDPNYVAPQRGGGGSDDDGPGTTTPEPKPWYEDVNLNDVGGYLDGLLTPEKEDQSFVGGILSGMPVVKAVSGITKLGNVAKARAAVMSAKIMKVDGESKYSDDEIAEMEAKIEKYIDDNNVNESLANAIAPGTLNYKSFKNKADKNKDGFLTPDEIAAATGIPLEQIVKQPTTGSTTKPATGQGPIDITKPGDDGGPSLAQKIADERRREEANRNVTPAQSAAATKGVTITNRTDSSGKKAGDTGYKSALRERQEAKAAASKAATKYGLDPNKKRGGRAEGGLMSKKKKK
jgi:hypothetical protein